MAGGLLEDLQIGSSLPHLDRLTLDEGGSRDSPSRQRRHSRNWKSLRDALGAACLRALLHEPKPGLEAG